MCLAPKGAAFMLALGGATGIRFSQGAAVSRPPTNPKRRFGNRRSLFLSCQCIHCGRLISFGGLRLKTLPADTQAPPPLHVANTPLSLPMPTELPLASVKI